MIPLTQAELAREKYTYNRGIERARADYYAHPLRYCRYETWCYELRDTDPYYCPNHREAADRRNAKVRAGTRKDQS